MPLTDAQQNLLRRLPGIDRILEQTRVDPFFEAVPKPLLTRICREVVEDLRKAVIDGRPPVDENDMTDAGITARVKQHLGRTLKPNLIPVVNATGVVVHTNLGRSLLADEAVKNVARISRRYTNLEFDLVRGTRGLRYSAIEGILCELTGAEAAMAVNNNAAAVLLCLDTLARGKEAVVSRGELVEIGGSFRIPDVMVRSGARLREVGTTNRTHLRDYEQAIGDDTGLLLKVHTSNFSVVGFTKAVPARELVELGHKRGIPVMEDLGSGTLVDLSVYGMIKEPTVQESVAAGIDVVTFSGDKLLGGPQAGLIVGKRAILDAVRQNPLTRALRIDKMTLAALETTLRIYRDPRKAVQAIPTLRMLIIPLSEIQQRAERFTALMTASRSERLRLSILDGFSRVGGGALPLQELPTRCVSLAIDGISTAAIERRMRRHIPPVIGRIEADRFILDFRTVGEDDIDIIASAVGNLLEK
ncbi:MULTISPECIES: L-seryl-tRNA(Sec) selenium transferase [Desulfococcus]|nr:L-seryl-tRNA(Sec) selenium transferase [Desulfococcus multivorans]AOY60594.1 SelA: L-seryl-tRNA(Sec) selenium transferase [Desulfococcus multivorans]